MRSEGDDVSEELDELNEGDESEPEPESDHPAQVREVGQQLHGAEQRLMDK